MYFSTQFHLKIRKMSSECALGPGLKNTEAKKNKKPNHWSKDVTNPWNSNSYCSAFKRMGHGIVFALTILL